MAAINAPPAKLTIFEDTWESPLADGVLREPGLFQTAIDEPHTDETHEGNRHDVGKVDADITHVSYLDYLSGTGPNRVERSASTVYQRQ